MKPLFYILLLLLCACSPKQQDETPNFATVVDTVYTYQLLPMDSTVIVASKWKVDVHGDSIIDGRVYFTFD